MLEHTGFKIIASGVISSMDGIEQLKTLVPNGVNQALCGKIIYEVKIRSQKSLEILANVSFLVLTLKKDE
tara:strand:- start:320 stop:529 length:210 start_codon:yes stop_codon:yes gene_type:complete